MTSKMQIGTPRATPASSKQDVVESEEEVPRRKRRRVRKVKKQDPDAIDFDSIAGVVKITLSHLAQTIVGCVIDEDVTTENPIKYIPKYKIDDNLELHEKSSEFLPIKKEINKYPKKEILLIYSPQIAADSFYICVTVEAENEVSRLFEELKRRQEERTYNSVYKTSKQWVSLGSETFVNDMIVQCHRPLLEVEVETPYPLKFGKVTFKFRLVQNAKDGYVELLPGRSVYNNLLMKQIDSGAQAAPPVLTNEVQTVCAYPKNAWTQYCFDFDPEKAIKKEFQDNFQSFIDGKLIILDDMLYVGAFINFYTSDYSSLIKDIKYTQAPEIATVQEYKFFLEENLCRGKQIVDLKWHPMWTGVIAIAYSDESAHTNLKHKPNKDEVTEAVYDVLPVLIWSFKDTLRPRLHLHTPREVSVVSFCPYDENILIGGCINGQIVVWDIKGKLEGVEKEEPLTAAQQRYRILMNTLVCWMKNVYNPKIVRPTAVSELEYSHRSTVTAIKWISVYREISKSGLIKDIPEEENRTSLQFMTASRDGTILTWNLLSKPLITPGTFKPPRKSKRLKERPGALTKDVSPYRILNRIFKPTFRMNIVEPVTNRKLPVSAFSLKRDRPEYCEVNPNPNRKFDVTERIYYKPILKRPTDPISTKMAVGTSEGDFVVATWDGFAFNSGAVVNEETCKIESFAKYHDGPIVTLSRSEVFSELILTVGGKVFAIWFTDFIGMPILYRRCKCRYTSGAWNYYRPSMFRLTRGDGSVEIWHLKYRSDRYQDIQFVCGLGVTKTSTHTLPMQQNVLGIADATGALRLFFVAHNLTLSTVEEQYSTYNLCKREVERKKKFLKWQADWIAKHADLIQAKKQKAALLQEEQEERKKQEKEKYEQEQQLLQAEANRLLASQTPLPGQYSEWANKQWLEREKERMNKVLLGKKALNFQLLEKQKLPLVKEEKEKKKKMVRQATRLRNAPKILEETVAMLFPDALEKLPKPPPDPYGGGDLADIRIKHYLDYQKLEQQCQTYVESHQYIPQFDWLKVLNDGKERRKILDGGYSRFNHKLRLLREKVVRGDLHLPSEDLVSTTSETSSEQESL